MKIATVSDLDFGKGDGLLPVITTERKSGKVLMLAYVNLEALNRTLNTGFAHYWSRSRSKLWKKGEESGHVQRIQEIRVDCDGDTLIYVVDQTGPACHTGEETCFFRTLSK
ncbi:MAG TPA: phosphoribosyl-AMP cyclohydrolase [Candidatus Saccharimonadales bacterium]|nr:phosphoribosyl-AMP cyclohydrolase [Candidatus Saccharimonadales bacterium]